MHMTTEEMKQRYEQLYVRMATSKDVRQMKIFGEAEHWAFCKVLMSDPKTAEAWLAKIEAVEWNNYLSEVEAKMIAAKLVNQDGTAGAKWDKATFLTVVNKHDGEAECAPYYNDDALWATAMMVYSDHAKSIAEDMGFASVAEASAEKMAMSVYRKAVESLKDRDRKYFVRQYFAEQLG